MKKCKVLNCNNKYYAKGYCALHYARLWRNNSLKPKYPLNRKCILKNCNRKHYALGYCSKHYNNLRADRKLERERCLVKGCSRLVFGNKPLCFKHYKPYLSRIHRGIKIKLKKDMIIPMISFNGGKKWKYKDYRRYQKQINKDKCNRCGTRKHLEIHHKDENKRNSNLSNLEVLCVSCHRKIHLSCKNP